MSPLTPDHVNPERPWPSLERLRQITESSGFVLAERLTVHPEYVRAGEPWIDPRVSGHVAALATVDGLGRAGALPVGRPWQEPDGGFASVGRTDLHASIDTEGRRTARREDFMSVYGDWDVLRETVAARDALARQEHPGNRRDAASGPGTLSGRLSADELSALRVAAANPASLERRPGADPDDR